VCFPAGFYNFSFPAYVFYYFYFIVVSFDEWVSDTVIDIRFCPIENARIRFDFSCFFSRFRNFLCSRFFASLLFVKRRNRLPFKKVQKWFLSICV
jgi:hypothetical protein